MIRANDLHRPQGWTGTSHLRTEGIKFLEKEIALEKAPRWERGKCFEDKRTVEPVVLWTVIFIWLNID